MMAPAGQSRRWPASSLRSSHCYHDAASRRLSDLRTEHAQSLVQGYPGDQAAQHGWAVRPRPRARGRLRRVSDQAGYRGRAAGQDRDGPQELTMDNTEHSNSAPFAILAALERQSHQRGAALPVEEEGQPRWRGIGFRLDGQRFVAALEEVAEVLVCPRLSPVPRTKAWVRGIANLRGSLLPVMDLGGFLGHAPTQLTRHSRILVIHQAGVHSGLLVDEVLG